MEQIEFEFKKGFNNGYLIKKYMPELSDKMFKTIEPANDYLDGLIQGGKEFSRERINSLEIDKVSKQSKRAEKNIDRER